MLFSHIDKRYIPTLGSGENTALTEDVAFSVYCIRMIVLNSDHNSSVQEQVGHEFWPRLYSWASALLLLAIELKTPSFQTCRENALVGAQIIHHFAIAHKKLSSSDIILPFLKLWVAMTSDSALYDIVDQSAGFWKEHIKIDVSNALGSTAKARMHPEENSLITQSVETIVLDNQDAFFNAALYHLTIDNAFLQPSAPFIGPHRRTNQGLISLAILWYTY